MKKFALGVVAISALVTGLLAAPWGNGWVEGKITRIQKDTSGRIVIYLSPDGSEANEVQNYLNRDLTGDERKEYYAVILTAKASDSTISLYGQAGDWKYFKLK